MQLSIQPYSLAFEFTFGVHGNRRSHTTSFFVKLEDDGYCGFGEACLPPYLAAKPEQTLVFLEKAETRLAGLKELPLPGELRQMLKPIKGLEDPGMAALDMALNDLLAKKQQLSFRAWKNIPGIAEKASSFTIGLGNEAEMILKLERARDFSLLKVKLGGENDRTLIQQIRALSPKKLFVDLNRAWTNREKALEEVHWLQEQGVILIEQPFAEQNYADSAWLSARSPLPIIADESIKDPEDLRAYYNCFSGINIKLMKCGGLDCALEMIAFARTKNLKVMLGCMAESSCGTTAMAQLAGLADYVDLDAPLLYLNDPFTGLGYHQGLIRLNDLPGFGTAPKDGLFGK